MTGVHCCAGAPPVAVLAEAGAGFLALGVAQLDDAGWEQVAAAVESLVESRGWTVTERRGDPLLSLQSTIELVARSFILGFPADIAIRITDEGGATFVDMRSVSRYGRHDLGENARRVASFMADLDAAMAVGAAQ